MKKGIGSQVGRAAITLEKGTCGYKQEVVPILNRPEYLFIDSSYVSPKSHTWHMSISDELQSPQWLSATSGAYLLAEPGKG